LLDYYEAARTYWLQEEVRKKEKERLKAMKPFILDPLDRGGAHVPQYFRAHKREMADDKRNREWKKGLLQFDTPEVSHESEATSHPSVNSCKGHPSQ
jgi:hypothetical protein